MYNLVDKFGIKWKVIHESKEWIILELNGKEYIRKMEFTKNWRICR